MAKKTVTFEATVPDKEPTQEISYKDIHESRVEDIIGNPKDEVMPEETKQVAEPVKEEKEIDFDPKTFKEEIVGEMSQKVADTIKEALGGNTKATEAEKDKYVQIAEDFEKQHGRPPSWHELVPFIVEEAKTALKAEQEAQIKAYQEQQQQVEQAKEARQADFNKYLDSELKELVDSGKLPNTEEARKALFQTFYEVAQDRQTKGLDPIYSIDKIFHWYHLPKMQKGFQPAGADAPVSAGRVAGGQDKGYSYNEIHNARDYDSFR